MALTLVLGGARSGKSRHAERLVEAATPPWTYIATYDPTWADPEMQVRLDAHRARRGPLWTTVEALHDLPTTLSRPGPTLVDCLTLWLTNLMLAGHDLARAIDTLLSRLAQRTDPTVLVGSEVGLGIVPETPLGRRFRDEAGLLHQRVAARADHVVLMVAGIPMVVK